MTVNYLSCFLFCLCVTYAGAVAAQWERSLPQWLWNPCSGNEKEQLHLPAAIDWLDNAQVRGAVDLFSWVFNLAKMSRWISLTVDVAQLRPEPSLWLWNMRLKRLLLRFSPWPWAHALASFVYYSSLEDSFTKQKCGMYSPCTFKSPLSDIVLARQLARTLTASHTWSICISWCEAPVTWANNMFWLSRVRVSSGRCCYVARKNRPPVVMRGQRAAGMESQSPAVRSVYGGGLCLRMSPCGLFTPSWTSSTLI